MNKNPLIQVSVQITAEAEEVVVCSLDELFGQPPSVYTDAETLATAATVYLELKEWKPSLRAEVKDRLEKIRECGLDIGSGKLTIRKVRREDWAESWKRHFKPIEVGKALLIKPSWSKRKAKKEQAVVVLDPGLSFGTGQHATTSFCLQQLVRSRRTKATQSFLDMGTGSGILAIAAARLGYSPVEAFDFDPESVRVSLENSQKNKVADRVAPAHRDLTKLPLKSKVQYDVVCANLMYDLLIAEAQRIKNRLKPDGSLVLAGILKDQFPKVLAHYQKLGFKLVRTKVEREWQSGLFMLTK